jgi:hypothetical protein
LSIGLRSADDDQQSPLDDARSAGACLRRLRAPIPTAHESSTARPSERAHRSAAGEKGDRGAGDWPFARRPYDKDPCPRRRVRTSLSHRNNAQTGWRCSRRDGPNQGRSAGRLLGRQTPRMISISRPSNDRQSTILSGFDRRLWRGSGQEQHRLAASARFWKARVRKIRRNTLEGRNMSSSSLDAARWHWPCLSPRR